MDSKIEIPTLSHAAQFFDDAVLTATAVNESVYATQFEELHPSLQKQLNGLSRRSVSLRGLSVVYSGFGFAPVTNFEGDAVTGYEYISYGRGVLDSVYLADAGAISYVDPRSFYFDTDDEHSDTLEVDEELERVIEFRNRLSVPPSGLRLYADFLVKDIAADQPIRGHAIRIPGYMLYNTIDLSTIEIANMETRHNSPEIGVHQVKEALYNASTFYRGHLRRKNFRNLGVAKQKKLVEQFLTAANDVIGIDRFRIHSSVDNVFLPDTETSSGFELYQASSGFTARCLRVDCIESKLLAENVPIRKRRGNVNSNASMCVVVEIDNETKRQFGIETNIVWLPVLNQLDSMLFIDDGIL